MFCLVLLFLSCNGETDQSKSMDMSGKMNDDSSTEIRAFARLDTALAKFYNLRKITDSLFYYQEMNQKYARLRDEMEIKYLRTGNDKYYYLCNKYDNLKVIYGKKGIVLQNSLKNKP